MEIDYKKIIKHNLISLSGLTITMAGVIGLLINYFYNRHVANNMLDKYRHPFIIPILFVIGVACYFLAKQEEDAPIKHLEYFTLLINICLIISFIISCFWWHASLYGFLITAILTAISYLLAKTANRTSFDEYCKGEQIEPANPNDAIVDVDINPGDFIIGNIYQHNLDAEGKVPEGEPAYVITDKKAVLPFGDRFLHTMILGTTGSGKTSQSLLPMFLQDFLADNFHYKKVDVVQLGQIVLEPKGDYAKTAWAIGIYETEEKREHYIDYLAHVKTKLNSRYKEIKAERKRLLHDSSPQKLTSAQTKTLKELEEKVHSEEFKALPLEKQNEMYKSYTKLNQMQTGKKLSHSEEESITRLTHAAQNIVLINRDLEKYVPLNLVYLNKCSSFALFKYASLLSDIIANPDLCDDSWQELIKQDPHQERDLVMLFDPQASHPLHFNPLYGPEDKAVATITSTLGDSLKDSTEYFKDMGKTLIQNSVHVVKQVYGNNANLLNVNDLMLNTNNRGKDIIKKLDQLENVNLEQENRNKDYKSYFLNDYYSGMDASNRSATKTYANTSGVRAALNNLLDDPKIREVLNPQMGTGTDIDFDKILRTGDKVVLSTATGTSPEVGRMLGIFLILQLQDAIMRRPGTEETRTPVILYIDEFQEYVSSGFEQILNQGRSFVVSVNVATQTMGLLKEKIGDAVANIDSNTRNKIIYPGGSSDDAERFEKLFGETKVNQVKRSVSSAVKSDSPAMSKVKKVIGAGEKKDSDRESVSENLVAQPRFSKTQILYGLNCDTYKINEAKSFGDVIYRIVSHGSTQLPAGARIRYIPADMKEKTDQLVRNYEASQRISNLKSQQPVAPTLTDPLTQENEFDNDQYKQEVEKHSPHTADAPNQLERDKSGSNTITGDMPSSNTEQANQQDTNTEVTNSDIKDQGIDEDDLPDSSELNDGLPDDLKVNYDDLNDNSDMFE